MQYFRSSDTLAGNGCHHISDQFQNRGQHHYSGYPVQNFSRPPRPRPLMGDPYFSPHRHNYTIRKITKPYRRRSHLNDIYGVNTEDGRFNRCSSPWKRPLHRNNLSLNFPKDVTGETEMNSESTGSSSSNCEHSDEYFPNSINILPKKQIVMNLNQKQSSSGKCENLSPDKTDVICEPLDINDNASSATRMSDKYELVTENIINLCSPERVRETPNVFVTVTADISEEEEPKKISIPFLENSNSWDAYLNHKRSQLNEKQSTFISNLYSCPLTVIDELAANEKNKILENVEYNKDLHVNRTLSTETCKSIPPTQNTSDDSTQLLNQKENVNEEGPPNISKIHKNTNEPIQRVHTRKNSPSHESNLRLRSLFGDEEIDEKLTSFKYSSSTKIEKLYESESNKMKRLHSNPEVKIQNKNKTHINKTKYKIPRLKRDVKESTSENNFKDKDSSSRKFELNVIRQLKKIRRSIDNSKLSTIDTQPQQSETRVCKDMENSANHVTAEHKIQKSYSGIQIQELKIKSQHELGASENKIDGVQLQDSKKSKHREDDKKLGHKSNKLKRSHSGLQIPESDEEHDFKNAGNGLKKKVLSKKLKTVQSRGSQEADFIHKIKKAHLKVHIQKLDSEIVKRFEKGRRIILDGKLSNVICEESKRLCNGAKQKNDDSKLMKPNSEVRIEECDKKSSKNLEKDKKQKSTDTELNGTHPNGTEKVLLGKNLENTTKEKNGENKLKRAYSNMHTQELEKVCKDLEKSSKKRMSENKTNITQSQSSKKSVSKVISKHLQQAVKDDNHINKHRGHSKHKYSPSSKDNSEKQLHSSLTALQTESKNKHKSEFRTEKTSSQVLKHRPSTESEEEKSAKKISLKLISSHLKAKTLNKKSSKKGSEVILKRRTSDENKAHKQDSKKHSNQSKNESPVKLMLKDTKQQPEKLLNNNSKIKLTSKDDSVEESRNVTKTNQNKNENQVELMPTDAGEELEYLLMSNENESQVTLEMKDAIENPENILKNNDCRIKPTPKDAMEEPGNITEMNQNNNESQIIPTPTDPGEELEYLLMSNKNESLVNLIPENAMEPQENLLQNENEDQFTLTVNSNTEKQENLVERNKNKNETQVKLALKDTIEKQIELTPKDATEDPHSLLKISDSGSPDTITLYRSDETVNILLELQATSATILPSNAESVEPKSETDNCEMKSSIHKKTDICTNTKGNNLSVNNTKFSNDTLHTKPLTLSKIVADILDDAPCATTTSLSNITTNTDSSVVTNVTHVLGSCANGTRISNTTTNINSSIIGNGASILDNTQCTNVTEVSKVTTRTNTSVMTNNSDLFDGTQCASTNEISTDTLKPSSIRNSTDIVNDTSCTNTAKVSGTTTNVNPSIIGSLRSIGDSMPCTNVANFCDGTNTTHISSLTTNINPSNIRNPTNIFDAASCAAATRISNITATNASQLSNVTPNMNHPVTKTASSNATQVPNHSKTLNMLPLESILQEINGDTSITNQPQNSTSETYIKVSYAKTNESTSVSSSLPSINGISNTSNNERNCFIQPSVSSLTSAAANTSVYEPISLNKNYVFNMNTTERHSVGEPAGISPSVPMSTQSMHHPILPVDNSAVRKNTMEPTRAKNSIHGLVCTPIVLRNLSELMENPPKPTSSDSNGSNSLLLLIQAADIIATNTLLYLIITCANNAYSSLMHKLSERTSYLTQKLDAELIAFKNYQNSRINEVCTTMAQDLTKLKWEQRVYDYKEILKSVINKIQEKHSQYTAISINSVMDKLFGLIEEKYFNHPHLRAIYLSIKTGSNTDFQVTTQGPLSPEQRDQLRNQIMCFNHLYNQNCQPSLATGFPNATPPTRVATNATRIPSNRVSPTVTMEPNIIRTSPSVNIGPATMTKGPLNVEMVPTNIIRGPPNVTVNASNMTIQPPNSLTNNFSNICPHSSSLSINQSVMYPPPYPHIAMLSNLNERNRKISNYVKGSTTNAGGMCDVSRRNSVESTKTTSTHLNKILMPTLNSNTVVNTTQNRPINPTQGNSFVTAINNSNALQTVLVNPIQDISSIRTSFQTNLSANSFQNKQVSAVPTNAAIHNTPTSNFNVDTLRISPIQSLTTDNINNNANAMQCQTVDKRKPYSVLSSPTCFSLSRPPAVASAANTNNMNAVNKGNQTGVTNSIPADAVTQLSLIMSMPRNEVNTVNLNANSQMSSPIVQNNTSTIATTNQMMVVPTSDDVGPVSAKNSNNRKTVSVVSQSGPVNSTILPVSTTISTDNHVVIDSSISRETTKEHSTTENLEEDTIELVCKYEDDEMILNQDVPEVASSSSNRGIPSHDIDANLQKYITMLIKTERTCVCKKPAEYLCSCKAAIYCSEECQKAEWGNHKLVCSSVFPKTNV